MQDSCETSFNAGHTDRSFNQGDVSVEDKSFSISLAMQDSLKSIIKQMKNKERIKILDRLEVFDRMQKEADEKS